MAEGRGRRKGKVRVKTKAKKRYRGITRHAEQLGVRREHLWMVLTGRRESRSLRERYAALVREEDGAMSGFETQTREVNMTKQVELKVCPFCGGRAEMIPWHGAPFLVDCVNDCCPANPMVTGYNEEDAARLWNTRADNRPAWRERRDHGRGCRAAGAGGRGMNAANEMLDNAA